MTRLTAAQIAQYAAAAGFRGTALRNAVAVALAESGGNPLAVGVNSDRWRSRDRGLWQINSHWHPEVTDALAFNPATCARAAYRISSGGTNWSPWSTWPTAAATQMAAAQIGVNQAAGSGAINADFVLPGPLPDIPLPGPDFGPFKTPADILGAVGNPLDVMRAALGMALKTGVWLADPHNWARVAMVSGGSVGILLALGMIAKSGAAGDTLDGLADAPGKVLNTAAGAVALVGTGGASVAAKAAGTAAKAGTATKAAAKAATT